MHSIAHVVEGIERLPATAAAFEHGEISWTQARLIAGVATDETEEHWLALARGRTVRALEAERA